ncbi:MAG: hypothetical protein JXX14_07150 [Deltaproteobacteria bacterium]|nr:hypothetical protein [Deltaproteobacteria bacterium]
MTSLGEPYIPHGGPPQTPLPSPQIFTAMGNEGIYAMLADFYRLLGKSKISNMFPNSEEELLAASRRSAAFFVQICGGPQQYTEKYGPPRLRARHMPFAISLADKAVWLDCFREVIETAPEKYGFPRQHIDGFIAWLTAFAGWMVNQRE